MQRDDSRINGRQLHDTREQLKNDFLEIGAEIYTIGPRPGGVFLLTLISRYSHNQTPGNPEAKGSSVGLSWVISDYSVVKGT